MKTYYLVNIESITDINSNNNFLEEEYPKIYKLHNNLEAFFLYGYYDSHIEKRKIMILKRKIENELYKNNLPQYLVFEGINNSSRVKELFSKEEIYLSEKILMMSKITSSNKHILSKQLNSYTPEEIKQVISSFRKFSNKKMKRKIISFPNRYRKEEIL